MAALDPKAHLESLIRLGLLRMTKDLLAVPEDKRNASPGGCARAPLHVVAECAVVNGSVAGFLTTGAFKRPSPEEREALLASYDTAEKAIAFLHEETEKLLVAIAGVDPDRWGDMSNEPFGRPASLFAVAELPGFHMMYHDGQLNYVHTLYGDKEVHW